jgi:hypothetical protein
LGVVVLNTNKMVYGTDWLAKMYLAGEVVAEEGEVDIAPHTQVDSYLMNSDPPDRGQELEEAGQAEDIGHKALRAYHTVRSSQRHYRWGRSVAAEVGHTDRKLGGSVAVDIEYSAGNDRIDAAEEHVVDAAAEAMMMRTAQDMVGAVVADVADDVADALTGEGGVRSGVGVDVGAHGERAGKGDVAAEAEAVGRTYGMAGVKDSQGQMAEAGERWQRNVYGVRTS